HRRFDAALVEARAEARTSDAHPLYIAGVALTGSGDPIVDTSPIDTSVVLGRFTAGTPAHIDRAVCEAHRAQASWARLPWRDRVATLRRAAELIRERKYRLAAI